jgi:hypothetical protein
MPLVNLRQLQKVDLPLQTKLSLWTPRLRVVWLWWIPGPTEISNLLNVIVDAALIVNAKEIDGLKHDKEHDACSCCNG